MAKWKDVIQNYKLVLSAVVLTSVFLGGIYSFVNSAYASNERVDKLEKKVNTIEDSVDTFVLESKRNNLEEKIWRCEDKYQDVNGKWKANTPSEIKDGCRKSENRLKNINRKIDIKINWDDE